MSDELSTKDKDEIGTLIGRKLGDYELVELMAAGGMARIYKGVDNRLQRTAAIKVLMRELMETDETLTERFEREARAIAALEHDNIVRIYQTGEESGYYFMAMKYVDGKDLADELNNLRRRGKNMEVKRALNILTQVANALDYAHTFDIIHRDIKPSNILLDKNDKAVLTDFGLALWQSMDKTMGTAFGTPRYISPEQALASEKSVPQSDIYSLAVVLYEILTGDMLFRADTPMQIALSHISEPPPPPRSINPSIPEAVERELLKALSKDPKKRHHTASEFINAVRDSYGPDLDKVEGITPPSVTGSKTPVLTDEFKKSLKLSESKVIASAGKEVDGQTAPANALPKVAERPKAQSKSRLPILILVAVVLIAVGAGGFAVLSGNNPGVKATAEGSTNEPTGSATTAPTQIPASAANSPLQLIYSWDGVVFKNLTEERLTVQGLEVTWDDVNSVVIDTNDLSQNGCATVAQLNSRDFNKNDFDCSTEKPLRVAQDKFFWRNTANPRFEVTLNGSVIGRCDAVKRGETIECPLAWPG